MSTTVDPEKVLSKAKVALMNKPDGTFVSTIVLSLNSSFSDTIDGHPNPTACTDGINLILNEKWFTGLPPLEQVGLLAHEAWHVALQHVLPDRRKNRDPNIWNQAADHVINNLLTANNFRIPKGGLCDPAYKDMTTEQVYEIIFKDKSKQDPNFVPDFTTGPGTNDPAAQAAHANQVIETLVRAATRSQLASDKAGSIPGDILIALEKLLYPKLPWYVILHDYFNGMAADDFTYTKPNRRFLPNYFLPTLYSEGMGTFACAVDTSGSVSDHDFLAFATEMNAAKEQLNPEKMYVIDFDTAVNSIYEIGEGADVTSLQFKGRGGTDLQPVFDHFEKKPPHVLVVFSDLECDAIEKNPGYPVIWIRTPGNGHTPTFGKLIEFDPND
jgi:predicted metal-dependent peptidase